MKTSKLKTGIMIILVVAGLVVAANAADAANCRIEISGYTPQWSSGYCECWLYEEEFPWTWVKAEAWASAYQASPSYKCEEGLGKEAEAESHAIDSTHYAYTYVDVWPNGEAC